jgi:hypothetical protein
MTPIVSRAGLPKGDTGCQHWAIKHRSELHKTTKKRGLAHRNRHGLNQARARVGLHGAHHAQQTGAAHNTVGIQHNHMVVVLAPTLQKLGDIAYLSMQILFATAIKRLLAQIANPIGKLLPLIALALGDIQFGGIAQHKEIKVLDLACCHQRIERCFKAGNHAMGIFVIDRHYHCSASGNGQSIVVEVIDRLKR